MAGLLPKSLWDESEQSITDAVIKPLTDRLTQSFNAYQQQAQQAAQPFKLPKPEEIFNPPSASAAPPNAQTQPSQPALTLPHPSDIFGTEAAATPATPSAPASANLPTAARSVPAAMPTGNVDTSGIASAGTRASRFSREIGQVASEEGVPAAVLAAIIDTEDSGETSTSVDGARGLTQVVPGQGFDLPGEDASDPLTSIRQSARALKEKYRMAGGDWQRAGGLYFGQGSDSLGNTSDVYQQKFDANRARYGRATSVPRSSTMENIPLDTGQSGRPEPIPVAPNEAPLTRGDSRIQYTQQGLADAGDPDAWAKCGPVAAFQFAQRMGRNPTPAETEELARQVGWTGQKGMAGFQSETALLARMNIAARAESGVDWDKVITDVSRGNPVILQLSGNEGHYITAQGYDPKTGKIDFGSTVGDLRAAGHQTQFTPSELENLGWGTPNAALYVDNPATPAPSVAAGGSNYKLSDTQPADAPSPLSPGDQKRAKLAAMSGPDRMPGGVSGPSDNATDPSAAPDYGPLIRQPGPLPIERQPDHVNNVNTEIRDRLNQQMYRQPLQQPADEPSPAGGAPTIGGVPILPQPENWQMWPPVTYPPLKDQTIGPYDSGIQTVQGSTTNPIRNQAVRGDPPDEYGARSFAPGERVQYRQQTDTPRPGTDQPIQNPDGSVTTERSITVTEPGLNGGRATNIPTVWNGRIVSDTEAVDNAIRSGVPFPSFGSVDEAVQAAEQRSRDLGAGQATSVGGASVPPEVQNALPNRNRPVRGGPIDESGGLQYRQPLSSNMGPDTATGDQQQTSSYNDPTDTGTLSQPLPAYTPTRGAVEDGVSAPVDGPDSATTSPRSTYTPPPSSSANDPGGAQFAAQDAYSTPFPQQRYDPYGGSSDPTVDATRSVQPDTAPTSPTSTQVPVWDDSGRVIGYRQAPGPRQSAPPVQATADMGPRQAYPLLPVTSMPGEPDYAPPRPTTPQPGGEPDYVPQRQGIGSLLQPMGGGLEISQRMRQIEANAAAAQGIGADPIRAMKAPTDPTWRAQNPEMAQEYDALGAQLGMVASAQTGDVPHMGSAPQTVEVLQQRLQQARSIVDRLIGSGDPERLAMAQENRAAIESQLVDAQNARRSLEPRIRSEIGTRIEQVPDAIRGPDSIQNVQSARGEGAYSNSPVPPNFDQQVLAHDDSPRDPRSINLNAQAGPSAGSQATTAAGNAIRGAMVGGVEGAMTDPGSPQGENESDADYAARRAREIAKRVGTHALVGGAAFAAGGALLPRGKGGAQALVGPGGGPGLGNVPPSQVNQGHLPGMNPLQAASPAPIGQVAQQIAANLPAPVQHAVQVGQTQAARLAAQGKPAISPLQWTRRLFAEAGYSSMIGPATASVNLMGNLLEPLYAAPKEATRGVARAISTGNMSALREPGEMAQGIFHGGVANGLREAGTAMLDALTASGRYAGTPGHEPLSAVTTNPIGRAITTGLEAGGRVFSALPDAIFGTIAQGAGEARTAAQMATDAGLTGTAWKQHVNDLLTDAKAVKSGQLPTLSGTQQVIDDGAAYAKRQTFQDELGEYGKKARTYARVGDMPVIGNLMAPFFNTPWNMGLRLGERTPVGFVMNSQASKFDRMYDATLGSALLIGLAAGPVATGTITGGGPDDPQKKSEMRSQGWRPYSTLIDGVYVPNRVMGIYGPLLNAAADVHDSIVYAKDKRPGSVASNYVGRVGQQLQQQPYLQGISNLMQAIQAGQGGGLGSAAERYASGTLTRMVPYASTARTIGTAMDPTERTSDRGKDIPASTTIAQQVRSGIGNRQGFESLGQKPLPAAQDVLGRDQTNPQQGAGALFAKTSSTKPDLTIKAFLDAGVDIPFPPTKAGDYIMTTEEKRAWNTARGQYLMQHLPASVPGLPPARRDERLKDLLNMANEAADRAVERTIPLNQRSQRRREAEAAQKAS